MSGAIKLRGRGSSRCGAGSSTCIPPTARRRVRLELWGDTLDTISYFDLLTQRRTEGLKEVAITPAAEIVYDDAEKLAGAIEALAAGLRGRGAAAQKENLLADSERLRAGGQPASLDKYIPLIFDRPATLFEYARGRWCSFRSCRGSRSGCAPSSGSCRRT